MTPIFFLVVYFLGILATVFRHPIYGLYTYLFTFYLAPNHSWWADEIPELRYLFIIAIVTVLSVVFRLSKVEGRTPWYRVGGLQLTLLFVIWNWLQTQWALSPEEQLESAIMYSKHLVIMVVIYHLIDSVDRLRDFALAHIIGCFWFGYLALDAGGGRLEDIGGAVAGANELGVHVTTALIFGGLLLTETGHRRLIIFGAMPFVANCLVLTISRGAFLGLLGGGLWAYLYVPRSLRGRFRLAGLLGILLISILAHDQLIDRFVETWKGFTTDETELDGSALSRSVIFKAGIRIGMDYPLGTGSKGTEILSPLYMPPEVLQRKTGQRAAHNTVAEVIAEHGFVGLALYLGMIVWVLRTMARTRSICRSRGWTDLELLSALIGASLVAIYVSGNFSANTDLETQYWCLALLGAVADVVQRRVAESTAPEATRPSIHHVPNPVRVSTGTGRNIT